MELAPPPLTLIIERTLYSSNQAWLECCHSFLPLLREHPKLALQLRSCSDQARDEKIWLHELLPPHPRIRMNGLPELPRPAHLREQDLKAGIKIPFSASVHDEAAIDRATSLGASYLHLGPLYAPKSKSTSPIGEARFIELLAYTSLPIVAVGGIDHTNIERVFELGAQGAALIGSVLLHSAPERYCLRLLNQLDHLLSDEQF